MDELIKGIVTEEDVLVTGIVVQCECCKKDFVVLPEQLQLILERMVSPVM